MNIYLICPVRGCDAKTLEDIERLVKQMEGEGDTVHWPHRDAPQSDPTGIEICRTHLDAMKKADEVRVVWDVESKGSHFDLGMAYALGKQVRPLWPVRPDGAEKSYWKVMCALG